MPIFRKGQGKHALAAAMAAVKMGDRCLQIGCTDGALLAAIVSKVGLSGRACASSSPKPMPTGPEPARRRAARSWRWRSPRSAGSLTRTTSFDVVVVDSLKGLIASARPAARVACLREARRVLAPRGRVIVSSGWRSRGFAGLFSRQTVDPDYRASGGAAATLRAEGFGAVRVLAERDGLLFVEGIR